MSNGGRTGSGTGSSSPDCAMPRTIPALTLAARANSAVLRGTPSASTSATRARPLLSPSAAPSGKRQP
jgi:hypothetical protein